MRSIRVLASLAVLVVLLALFLLAGCFLIAAQSSGSAKPLSRDRYAEIDLWDGSRPAVVRFHDEYDQALEAGEVWTTSPLLVSLRFAGYPNVDGAEPDQIVATYASSTQVTVVVLAEDLLDDSVKDREERIDLVRVNGVWRIV